MDWQSREALTQPDLPDYSCRNTCREGGGGALGVTFLFLLCGGLVFLLVIPCSGTIQWNTSSRPSKALPRLMGTTKS